MVKRYKIIGKNMKFSNAGSFGLKSLAEKKCKQIKKTRKEAKVPYKSVKVKKYEV